MDGVREFLEAIRKHELAAGRFRGLLHVLIGRRITRPDGTLVSAGVTWREVSNILKLIRWDKESVRELGIDPDSLPPRDRQRYWYTAITQAGVNSAEARQQADELSEAVASIGYVIRPPAGASD